MPNFRSAAQFNGIPTLGFCPYVGSSAPGSPANGQLWYDTTNKVLKTYDTATSTWEYLLLDTTGTDIQPLGTQAAGASGKIADAKHVHAMPALSALAVPTASVAMNTQKLTGLANGSASTDSAAFGQIPLVDTTAADFQGLGTAAAGSNGKWSDSGHTHPATCADNLTIAGDGLNITSAGAAVVTGETVSSTATVTVASLGVPANEPQDNVVYEIDIFGAYGTASSGTNNLTFTVNWGVTGLGSNAFTMPNSINVAAPARWRFKATISFTSTTLCYSNLRLELAPSNTASTAVAVYLWGANPSTGTTVTTSTSQTLALTLAWSVNSASNGVFVTGGRIWKAC